MRFFGRPRSSQARPSRTTQELLLLSIGGDPEALAELEKTLLFMDGYRIVELEESRLSVPDQRAALSYLQRPNPSWPVVALLAHHRSGWVREAAVVAAHSFGPRILPFMVERVNDWVPSVAEKAQGFMLGNLPRITPAVLERAIPPLCHVHRSERNDLRNFWLLAEPELAKWPDVLESAPVSRIDERWLQELALRSPHARYDKALRNPDPAIRIMVVRRALEAYRDADREELLERLTEDRSSRIRRLALDASLHRPDLLRIYAVDTNWYLRAAARHELSKQGFVVDPAFYLQHPRTPGSIAGLGDVGNADVVPALMEALEDARVAVRRNALRSLGRIGGEPAKGAVKAALFDGSAKVSRDALEALASMNAIVERADVDKLLAMPNHGPVAIRATEFLNRWRSLAILLQASKTEPSAEPAIARWLDRRSSAGIPAADDAAEVCQIADAGLAHLPPNMQEALREEIAFARKALST